MGYPWYSTGRRMTGRNRMVACSIDENCNTKQRRYRFEWIKVETGRGKKSESFTDIVKAQDLLEEMFYHHSEWLHDATEICETLQREQAARFRKFQESMEA